MTEEIIATYTNEPDEEHTHSAYIHIMFGRRRVWTTREQAAKLRHGANCMRSIKAAQTRKAEATLKAYKAGLGTAEAATEAIERRSFTCNSDERLVTMLATMGKAGPVPREIFWPVFYDCWSRCDDTWHMQDYLIRALRHHAPAILPEDEQKVFDALPDQVRVYRGCSRTRIMSASWTTERTMAENFARGHRFIPVPDPVIATGMIAKSDIFLTNNQRKEDEVLLDPYKLRELSVEAWVPKAAA